jgi:protein TonB
MNAKELFDMSIELSAVKAMPGLVKTHPRSKPTYNVTAANDELLLPDGLASTEKPDFSSKALFLVVAGHVLVVSGLLLSNSLEPDEASKPEAAAMMVSLVSNPAPEEVEIIPEPERIPEPKLVIRKPEPVQKVVEPEPVPQPVEPVPTAEAAPAVTAEPNAAPVSAPVVAQQEPLVVEEVKEVIEPPKFGAAYLHNPAPKYPSLSRRIGEEGRVLLRVLVAASGAAESVEIETGSGSSRLDQAAVDAVKKWRFIPAKRDKEPISAFVIVPIQFTLNG